MRNRLKWLVACALALCISTGMGFWFVASQSNPIIDEGPLVQVGEENASVYGNIRTTRDLLDCHGTIVTAKYQSCSEPYSMGVTDVPLPDGTTIDILEWYVDTTYEVKESLRGDLQPNDTITIQEHLQSETDLPYSRIVNSTGSDSTLLFLEKEQNGYRISTPYLSMQPVVKDKKTGERKIIWLNGLERQYIEGTNVAIYANSNRNNLNDVISWDGQRQIETIDMMYDTILNTDEVLNKSDTSLSNEDNE